MGCSTTKSRYPSIDNAAILDLIETIYLCGSGAADWQSFLDQFGALFPALKCAMVGYDNSFSNAEVFYTSNFDPAYIDAYREHYYKLNPWQNLVLNAPSAPSVAWGHDAVPLVDLQKTEFYSDWVKPQDDVATGFTTMLVREPDRFINLTFNVNPTHIEEAQSAAQAFTLIGPHLRRAFELHRQLMGARFLESGYQSLLHKLPSTVFIVEASGKLKFSNAKGEQLLSEGRVVKSNSSGQLCFTNAHDHLVVTESIRRTATRKIPDGRELIPLRATAACRYLAFVTPLATQRRSPVSRGETFLLPEPPIAVFVIDLDEAPKAKVETIAAAFNLTPAEARLAFAVLNHTPLKQYAAKTGISFHTARAQMRALLEKTDTHRQADFVHKLANLFCAINLT